jgi:NTP pyrophosphatase (non-canonical NTP hydrolase)
MQLVKLEYAIQDLIRRRAVHEKKKVCVADATKVEMWVHLLEEVHELGEGMGVCQDAGMEGVWCDNGTYDNDNVTEELADILGLVLHIAIRNGDTAGDIVAQAIKKLEERYPK